MNAPSTAPPPTPSAAPPARGLESRSGLEPIGPGRARRAVRAVGRLLVRTVAVAGLLAAAFGGWLVADEWLVPRPDGTVAGGVGESPWPSGIGRAVAPPPVYEMTRIDGAGAVRVVAIEEARAVALVEERPTASAPPSRRVEIVGSAVYVDEAGSGWSAVDGARQTDLRSELLADVAPPGIDDVLPPAAHPFATAEPLPSATAPAEAATAPDGSDRADPPVSAAELRSFVVRLDVETFRFQEPAAFARSGPFLPFVPPSAGDVAVVEIDVAPSGHVVRWFDPSTGLEFRWRLGSTDRVIDSPAAEWLDAPVGTSFVASPSPFMTVDFPLTGDGRVVHVDVRTGRVQQLTGGRVDLELDASAGYRSLDGRWQRLADVEPGWTHEDHLLLHDRTVELAVPPALADLAPPDSSFATLTPVGAADGGRRHRLTVDHAGWAADDPDGHQTWLDEHPALVVGGLRPEIDLLVGADGFLLEAGAPGEVPDLRWSGRAGEIAGRSPLWQN